MKKYFLFAAVAGMLASCSSESLTAGSDPNIEPTQDERVPILLSVSSPSVKVSRGTTRAIGTGTVGGVGTGDTNNKWYGQKINAFMFEKGGLTLASNEPGILYENTQMITPGSNENKIDDPVDESTPKAMGEAMRVDKKILYYPASQDFDFFGYHGAGATGAVDKTTAATTLWTVPFTIEGSNDLMSTKATTLDYDDLSDEQKAKFGSQATYNAFITEGHFFSAKAARKLIQPVLKFNHLLSRLSFVVVPGNDNAGGWSAGTQNAAKAVSVKKIEVYSKTTGTMAVAWTNEPANKITWDDNGTADDPSDDGTPDWLTLKERPATYCLNSAPATATSITKAAYDALPDDATAGDQNDKTDYSIAYYLKSNPATIITETAWKALSGEATDGDANDKTDYTRNINTNDVLVPLTPTYPIMTHAYDADHLELTPVGEALIVAPKLSTEGAYQMRITVSQNVKTDWDGSTEEQTYTSTLDIPAPANGFEANTSYQVRLTVYGFERIEVMTEITPWTQGATIPVGQDD